MTNEEIPEELILAVGKKHNWDQETTKEKILIAQELLGLDSPLEAIPYLLQSIPISHKEEKPRNKR